MPVDVSSNTVMIRDIGVNEVAKLQPVLRLMKLMSEPNRLRIFALLTQGERCVCDIETATHLPQNLVSHHLRALREVELIECRRDGRWAYYRINRGALARVYPLLCDLFNPDALSDERASCAD